MVAPALNSIISKENPPKSWQMLSLPSIFPMLFFWFLLTSPSPPPTEVFHPHPLGHARPRRSNSFPSSAGMRSNSASKEPGPVCAVDRKYCCAWKTEGGSGGPFRGCLRWGIRRHQLSWCCPYHIESWCSAKNGDSILMYHEFPSFEIGHFWYEEFHLYAADSRPGLGDPGISEVQFILKPFQAFIDVMQNTSRPCTWGCALFRCWWSQFKLEQYVFVSAKVLDMIVLSCRFLCCSPFLRTALLLILSWFWCSSLVHSWGE